jgi:hypothetical protein
MKLLQEGVGFFRSRFGSEEAVCRHAGTYSKEKPKRDKSYIEKVERP